MGAKLIESALSVNNWMARLPSAAGVRPVQCPHCGAGAHRRGELGMHGHGVRQRALHVATAGADGTREETLTVRRYRCRDCGRVCTVVPRMVLRQRRNDRVRIGVVLVLWVVGEETLSGLRARYAPRGMRGDSGRRDWPMVRRWVREAVRIFGAGCPGGDGPVRSMAQRITAWILAHEPPESTGCSLSERAVLAVCSGAF